MIDPTEANFNVQVATDVALIGPDASLFAKHSPCTIGIACVVTLAGYNYSLVPDETSTVVPELMKQRIKIVELASNSLNTGNLDGCSGTMNDVSRAVYLTKEGWG